MPIKVIDLPAEDAPTPDDLVIIRDNLTGTTRKIPLSTLFASPPIGAGVITTTMIADGAISKAKLGADAKIGVRTRSQASPGTLTPDMLNYDVENVTNLNSGMTIAAPLTSSLPNLLNRQGIMFSIKDNGTAQSLSWAGIYRAVGVTIPGATVAGKMLYVAGRWNAEAQLIDILSVGRE